MSLIQLIIPLEVAHDTIAELGELGNVQFKDVRLHFLYSHELFMTLLSSSIPRSTSSNVLM